MNVFISNVDNPPPLDIFFDEDKKKYYTEYYTSQYDSCSYSNVLIYFNFFSNCNLTAMLSQATGWCLKIFINFPCIRYFRN